MHHEDILRYYERPQNPWAIQTNDAHLSFMEISTCLVLDTSMTTGVKGLYFGFFMRCKLLNEVSISNFTY